MPSQRYEVVFPPDSASVENDALATEQDRIKKVAGSVLFVTLQPIGYGLESDVRMNVLMDVIRNTSKERGGYLIVGNDIGNDDLMIIDTDPVGSEAAIATRIPK